MKICLAARYGRRKELLGYAAELEDAGHVVTSRWIRSGVIVDDQIQLNPAEEVRLAARLAQETIDDVTGAELLILFTETPGSVHIRYPGDRLAAFGYALGHGLGAYIVGPAENCFCCLPNIARFESWDKLRAESFLFKGVAVGT